MRNFGLARFFSQRPWLISLLVVCALSFWMALGTLKAEETEQKEEPMVVTEPLARVVYDTFSAEQTARSVELYGRTAPEREAMLGAEVAGKVVKLLVQKGDVVAKGDGIVQLDKAGLETQLERARASLQLREKEYKAAQSLKSRGLQGEVAFTQAQAALVDARAGVKDARRALNNALIEAPFSGVVDDLLVELGGFVGVGDPVARFIDLSTLVVEVDVSERHVQGLKIGQLAQVRLIDNSYVEGSISYISRISSPATNTFPVEIEIENRDNRIPAGISTEVDLDLELTQAIKVTPAMLALDEDGNLGVKVIESAKVRFVPIQLVRAEQDGVWLSGLGESADIITRGQGFVRDGDKVEAVKRDEQEQN